MAYHEELRETLKRNAVAKIAIVDDAYDPLDLASLNAADKRQVRTTIDDLLDRQEDDAAEEADIATWDALAAAGIAAEQVRDGLDDPGLLETLWAAFIGAEPDAPLTTLLRPLFGVAGVDRAAKLRPLRRLKAIIENDTEATVTEFGSDAAGADVAGFDMVFLDYYLSGAVPAVVGPGVTKKDTDDARDRSVRFLKELIAAASRIPLVMLISSAAVAEDLPKFRADTAMLASKLSFLPKEIAVRDPARAQHKIMGLAKFRGESDALWKLMETWQRVVAEASNEVLLSLRELDVMDFSYIQEFRLADEKTPFAQYLIWLLGGKLTDEVEQMMRKREADKLVKSVVLPQAIPGRVGPTAAITGLYSAATTSRLAVANETFKPKTWSGYIYIDTASYNRIYEKKLKVRRRAKNLPQVLAVLTPACDLVPGRSSEDKLKTVTMIGGSLVPLEESLNPSNHLIMLNDKPYIVDWNTKWPVTMTVDAMATENLGGRYQWVGRLREMYHADLQQKLMADVGRVGLPVAPPMSEAVGVRVLARTGGGPTGWTAVIEHGAEDRAAWTFPASKGKRAFCLREDVVWEVREWVLGTAAKDKWGKALDAKLSDGAVIGELQLPVTFQKLDEVTGSSKAVHYRRVKNVADVTTEKKETQFLVVFGRVDPPSPPKQVDEELGDRAIAATAVAA
ncbi:hypothetical protein [Sphingomonas aerolata]|uniref:hypothetical protein n=1 Tax=Sphingomonas aerolata TaxID=185951 RepID=UPI00208F1A79|nr:hypothetical protein [Sphingomonas aerolata]USR00326.1 hypothetical protein NEF64_00180 [Sphingomonas aerolata]